MPYRLEQSGSGFYVVGPSGRHSKQPMPRTRAVAQMRALYAAETWKDYDARAGQQIIGNLYRGAGGKFTAGAGGSLTAAQQREQNRARERNEYGRAEDEIRAREDDAIAAEPNRKKRAALRRATILARRQRLYARREQRRQMDEADAQERARDAQARNEATARRRAARDAERETRRRQVEERRAQARGEKPKKERKDPAEVRKANRAAIRQQMAANDAGLAPGGFDAFTAFLDGASLSPAAAQSFVALGLVDGDPPRLTSVGRTLGRAIDKGNYRGAVDAVNEGAARVKKRQEADAKREAKQRAKEEEARIRAEEDAMLASITDPKARAAFRRDVLKARRERKRKRDNPPPPPGSTGGPVKRPGGTAPRPPSGGETPGPVVKEASLVVYKDASGRDRWISVSSTAYKDRDGEIVSRKALQQAVAKADLSGSRGPLRFWHVPGLDLGDCDYQATAYDGRLLLESGTFHRPAYAAALKANGAGYGVSIGFIHPPTQPDAHGVFTDIAIFERSLCPPGRASNYFTSITTKESLMTLTTEKDAQLAQLLGGQDSPAYQAAIAQLAQTDKAAQGTTFKEAAPTVYTAPDGTQGLIQNGAFVALKAEAAPEEEMAMADEAAAEDEAAASGSIFTDEEIAVLADAVAERVAAKLGGAKAAKEVGQQHDPIAALMNELTALKAHVARLEGDQPQAARASQSADTVIPPTDPLVNGYKSVADNPEAVIAGFLNGFRPN